ICKEQETWGGVDIWANFIEENFPKRQRRLAGNYTVCLEKNIAPSKKGCLIYSFGINFDWTFEERAEDYGCQVLAFDPSMAVSAHHHSLNIFFSPKGLSDFDGVIKKENQLWNMTRFSTLLEENNHAERIIDILKLDIEGSEYEAIPDMIYNNNLKNVKQIFFETHNNTALSLERYYSIYWLLSINNFVCVASEDWPHWGCARKNKEGTYEIYCYVFTFINMKYVAK
ncbi:probable methyltransferase-like protein 24, partial [Artemia franciscana]|uniref:probable methyltransferase-like protein 24 n=1 Tax=Artemia franciscana TaxID=6661 RepID=UPI0032DB562D